MVSALSSSGAGAGLGLGLGLFGVLSIIRLRFTELDEHEVAYYFSALALGILGALDSTPAWRAPLLMALILVVMFLGDHPRLLRRYRPQLVILDSAIADHVALVTHLQQILGARVFSATVQRLNLVNDTTVVDVRHAHGTGAPATATTPWAQPLEDDHVRAISWSVDARPGHPNVEDLRQWLIFL